jgi:tetratricopeptide (TPR) repeat protein
MVFGARVLFYPTENHHKALQDWLQMMVDNFKNNPSSSSVEEIKPLDTSLSVRIRIEDKYIHKPSDDENYKGRKDELVLLNRWANDPETRIIAIMGIGGQGKTSLTGRWLKYERIDNLINIPVFYWSFYEDLDVGKFFKEIIKFCIPITNLTRNNQIEPISFIISLVHEFRLLIVLDGLEVLQEEAANPNHGKFNHPLLYHFLLCWVRLKHKSLIILTSRFHFPQLQKYCGIGFHQLDLFRLNKKDGTALLRKLNIFGDEDVIGNYIEKLYGHPLALRVLASNIKRSCFGDISRFNGEIILNDEKNDKLNEKLKRLLNFYEKQLKDGQKELICILSLFKRPIELKSFVNLLNKMKSIANTPLAKADKSVIEKQINLLVDDFLVEKSKDGITTHPVIRDYFRATLNASRSSNEVAIFLKEKPGSESPTKIEEVQDLVEAVQLLCEDEDFDTANKLTHERLSVGGYGYDIFISLPAIKEGLELSLAFVGDKTRCKKIEKVLGKRTLAFHFSGAYLYNYYLGNFQQAIFYLNKCLEICRQTKDKLNMPGPIQEISLIEISAGKIEKGIKTIEQAICMSDKIRYLDHLRTQFSYLAYYKYLLGNSQDSFKYFEISLLYEQRRISSEKHLTSIYGNQQAEFLIRIKVWDKFELVNNWNIQNCINFYQNNDLAIAYLLKAWSKVQHTALIEAEEILLLAENILRTSCMLQEICRLDWIWALLFEAKKDFIKGLNHINNSLPICVDRGFHLWQADHFVLRGRLYLMQFNKENPKDINLVEKAGDNGKEALRIADNTGYIWVKVDALKLLASYHQTRAQLPDFDKGKELEFTQRFLNEASSIEKGLYLTEEQMKESIKQASREFEKQTEGWKSAY